MATRRLRVVIYGLGEIGTQIARLVLLQSHLELVGALDRDPAKVGADLQTLLESPRLAGLQVSNDPQTLLRELRPDVIVIATTSLLKDVLVQIRTALAAHAAVVSTCEQLIYPYSFSRELAAELDREARAAGVGVIGVGNNPGFVMDLLPILLSATCSDISCIRVIRVINASERRPLLLSRIGAGLDPVLIRDRLERHGQGAHIGLSDSLRMIADALGWQLDRVSEHAELIVADEWIRSPMVTVAPGQVAGFAQEARGYIGRREVLELRWRAAVGEPNAYDAIAIDGRPPLDVLIRGGLHGDQATAALITRAIPAICAAPPGLHTVLDLPIMHYVAPPWRGGQYSIR